MNLIEELDFCVDNQEPDYAHRLTEMLIDRGCRLTVVDHRPYDGATEGSADTSPVRHLLADLVEIAAWDANDQCRGAARIVLHLLEQQEKKRPQHEVETGIDGDFCVGRRELGDLMPVSFHETEEDAKREAARRKEMDPIGHYEFGDRSAVLRDLAKMAG